MLRYKPHAEYYHLASLLCRAGLNARAAIARIAGRHVLTYGRHAILIEIANQPGIHVREVARRIQLTRQSTLEAARELEHPGWLPDSSGSTKQLVEPSIRSHRPNSRFSSTS